MSSSSQIKSPADVLSQLPRSMHDAVRTGAKEISAELNSGNIKSGDAMTKLMQDKIKQLKKQKKLTRLEKERQMMKLTCDELADKFEEECLENNTLLLKAFDHSPAQAIEFLQHKIGASTDADEKRVLEIRLAQFKRETKHDIEKVKFKLEELRRLHDKNVEVSKSLSSDQAIKDYVGKLDSYHRHLIDEQRKNMAKCIYLNHRFIEEQTRLHGKEVAEKRYESKVKQHVLNARQVLFMFSQEFGNRYRRECRDRGTDPDDTRKWKTGLVAEFDYPSPSELLTQPAWRPDVTFRYVGVYKELVQRGQLIGKPDPNEALYLTVITGSMDPTHHEQLFMPYIMRIRTDPSSMDPPKAKKTKRERMYEHLRLAGGMMHRYAAEYATKLHEPDNLYYTRERRLLIGLESELMIHAGTNELCFWSEQLAKLVHTRDNVQEDELDRQFTLERIHELELLIEWGNKCMSDELCGEDVIPMRETDADEKNVKKWREILDMCYEYGTGDLTKLAPLCATCERVIVKHQANSAECPPEYCGYTKKMEEFDKKCHADIATLEEKNTKLDPADEKQQSEIKLNELQIKRIQKGLENEKLYQEMCITRKEALAGKETVPCSMFCSVHCKDVHCTELHPGYEEKKKQQKRAKEVRNMSNRIITHTRDLTWANAPEVKPTEDEEKERLYQERLEKSREMIKQGERTTIERASKIAKAKKLEKRDANATNAASNTIQRLLERLKRQGEAQGVPITDVDQLATELEQKANVESTHPPSPETVAVEQERVPDFTLTDTQATKAAQLHFNLVPTEKMLSVIDQTACDQSSVTTGPTHCGIPSECGPQVGVVRGPAVYVEDEKEEFEFTFGPKQDEYEVDLNVAMKEFKSKSHFK
jgi:hypothetical protein